MRTSESLSRVYSLYYAAVGQFLCHHYGTILSVFCRIRISYSLLHMINLNSALDHASLEVRRQFEANCHSEILAFR